MRAEYQCFICDHPQTNKQVCPEVPLNLSQLRTPQFDALLVQESTSHNFNYQSERPIEDYVELFVAQNKVVCMVTDADERSSSVFTER